MTRKSSFAPTVHRVSGLMVFLLLAMLALFSMIAVMLGIQIYNNVVETSETNSAVRTSLAYVASKVRANDAAGMIELRNIDGIDVIVLGNDSHGQQYNTYIYYQNGALREYYINAEEDFNPIYGTIIVEVPQFSVDFDGELFRFSVTDANGQQHEMQVYVHSAQIAARGA